MVDLHIVSLAEKKSVSEKVVCFFTAFAARLRLIGRLIY